MDACAQLPQAADAALDELAGLARMICQAPVSRIVFNDAVPIAVRQDMKASTSGLSPFFEMTLHSGDLLVLRDAGADRRFASVPLVTSEHMRLYAGVPLVISTGRAIGALCVMDFEPRDLGPEQQEALRTLGRQIVAQVELRRSANEIWRMTQFMRRSQKMEALGRLAGGIAHDFNNLLTAILGFSDVLLQQAGEGGADRVELEEIRKAAERGAALTRQLLIFCRKQSVQPRVLNLNDVIADLQNLLRELIPQNIQVSILADPLLGPIRADPSQMEQVILNLVLNARDAMPGGGRLSIISSNIDLAEDPEIPPGRYALLAVCDTGTGMDETTISHLFEPFFTTKEQGSGTGLGLATVYGAVKQNGGHIRVDSRPGQGTKFQIYLPRLERPEPVPETGTRKAPARGGGETILLVDDEPSIRLLARTVLQKKGYVILEGSNGVEALDLSDRHAGPIDLLLTDVLMPQMGGAELAQEIAKRRPGIAIVFMSGRAETLEPGMEILKKGAVLIDKPFTVEDLAGKVRAAMDARRTPTPDFPFPTPE